MAALFDPAWERAPSFRPGTLVLLLDASESQLRGGSREDWSASAAKLLRERLGDIDQSDQAAIMVPFGDDALPGPGIKLGVLADEIVTLSPSRLPAAQETDLGRALETLLELSDDARGATSALLISDGIATRGEVGDALLARLRRAGVPVHVLPRAAKAGGAGIIAANLAPEIEVGRDARLRLVLGNPGAEAVRIALSLSSDGAEPLLAEQIEVAPGRTRALTLPVLFERAGLHAVRLDWTSGAGGPSGSRRLFTLVNGPPRLLSISTDHAWRTALDPAEFEVERLPPGSPFIAADYDAVVIDGVHETSIHGPSLRDLARAVQQHGSGLLLINGEHQGRELATVLGGHSRGPLGPVLPLTAEPRLVDGDMPPRSVYLVVDVSGSMTRHMGVAKRTLGNIVSRLRPVDRAALLTFNSGAGVALSPSLMDRTGRRAITTSIELLRAGGGTDPGPAMKRLRGFVSRLGAEERGNCGVFFISDGEFRRELRQPGCLTTALVVGHRSVETVNQQLKSLGEVHAIGERAADPVLRFFEPRKETLTFEEGEYLADDLMPQSGLLPSPMLPLWGNAIGYAVADARLVAARPYPPDPVLAFVERGRGRSGALATALPRSWLDAPSGREAVSRWVGEVLAWSIRDRWLIGAEDQGDEVELRLLELAGSDSAAAAEAPRIAFETLAADRLQGASPRLRADASTPGRWIGRLPLADRPQTGDLRLDDLDEQGQRRSQRIPIWLPARSQTRPVGREAWSAGLEPTLLKRIAAATGGRYDPEHLRLTSPSAESGPERIELWPPLVLLAAWLFVSAIAARRLAA